MPLRKSIFSILLTLVAVVCVCQGIVRLARADAQVQVTVRSVGHVFAVIRVLTRNGLQSCNEFEVRSLFGGDEWSKIALHSMVTAVCLINTRHVQ